LAKGGVGKRLKSVPAAEKKSDGRGDFKPRTNSFGKGGKCLEEGSGRRSEIQHLKVRGGQMPALESSGGQRDEDSRKSKRNQKPRRNAEGLGLEREGTDIRSKTT